MKPALLLHEVMGITVKTADCIFTVGEFRSGVTGFASIYATDSHRYM